MKNISSSIVMANSKPAARKSTKLVHRVHTLSLSQAMNLTLIDSEGQKLRFSAQNPNDLIEVIDRWVETQSGYVLDLKETNNNVGFWIVEDIKDAVFEELLDGGTFEDVDAELRYFCGVIRHSKLDKDLKKGVLNGLYKSLKTSNLRKFWVELRKAQMA